MKKHKFKFFHAFVFNHEIYISYKCKHCGEEKIVQKK